ncbi:Cu(I)-responsive transcriptional regulator [uncultured Jannaschia sp.]|uniref:Cu(I)-responsive transcriptional regulator n=1 Tax=uncultured Jannaschia sp. TaxID=293347 RepID=UPI00261B6090|nr:Cu(I)-responsive transcriptional regulator [uncultured Jannaschia sp.]
MNISDAAERSGLPAKTIRYYEEVGLVTPERGANGYRRFSERDVHDLTFLGRSRALGFGLGECRALLALWRDDARASAEVKRIATDHLAGIEARIADLRAMQDTLRDLVNRCAGDDRPDCPILHSLQTSRPER